MKHFFLLLFTCIVFSQNKPLEFKIDSITAIDSTASKRIYSINYHIENRTDSIVSFVLNTKRPIPINHGSQSEMVYFKIFENETAINMDKILESYFKNTRISSKTYEGISLEELEKIQREETMAYFRELNRKSIMENIIRLAPKETRNFQSTLFWNRERYRKDGDIEYYISETNTHFLELAFNLLLEPFENLLSPDDYKIISTDPTIIKGWYTSNRVEIDFRQ